MNEWNHLIKIGSIQSWIYACIIIHSQLCNSTFHVFLEMKSTLNYKIFQHVRRTRSMLILVIDTTEFHLFSIFTDIKEQLRHEFELHFNIWVHTKKFRKNFHFRVFYSLIWSIFSLRVFLKLKYFLFLLFFLGIGTRMKMRKKMSDQFSRE